MPPSSKFAQIALSLNSSALASGLRSAAGLMTSFASGAGRNMSALVFSPKNAPKGTSSWAGHMVGQVSGTLAMRGIDMMIDQGKGVLDFERKLTRFGVAAKQTPMQLNELRKEIRKTSVDTGVDAIQVLDAARAYVDLAGAANASSEKMRILARTGQASEAAGADLAGMMYQLTRSMKVTDGQMEDTMGGLINQAKEGAIEAKQMAAEFSGMMPIFARFGIVGREGAVQLGAMYQVTRDGFDSAAQASTGMIRLMAGFQRHASRFEKFGVHVFKPGSKKDLRDLSDILTQVKKSPLNNDIEALIKSFGRSEAWRTFELLADAPARLRELEQAGRENGVIQKDLATIAESAGGRIDIAIAKAKNSFAEMLTPERITQIVGGIEGMARAMGPLMNAVAATFEGFSRFAHLVARAKNSLQGDSKYEPTDDEQAILESDDLNKRREYTGAAADETAKKAAAIRQKAKDYNAAIGGIVDQEDDFGVTDASIKAAIRLGNAAVKGPHLPGDQAGLNYLDQRKGDISDARYQRIAGELEDERRAGMTSYAQTQEKYQKLLEQDLRKERDRNPGFEALTAALVALQKSIDDERKKGGPKVHIDGNPVAHANHNATDRRRH